MWISTKYLHNGYMNLNQTEHSKRKRNKIITPYCVIRESRQTCKTSRC